MRRTLALALVASATAALAACGGSGGPTIVSFKGPDAVSCGKKGVTKTVGFTYKTKGATAVEPSVDGQAIGAQAGYDPAGGTMNFPYVCPGPHTVTITAFGKGNKSSSKSADLEPSSAG